jgi:hypothetical protein
VSPGRKPLPISLFGRCMDLSFVPAKAHAAVARSGGPEPGVGPRSEGRPLGRHDSASLLTAASPMAALRSLGTMLFVVAIFASSMLLGDAAHAEPTSSATHRARSLPIDPFAAFIAEASKRFAVPEHWIRAVMHVESAGKSQARSQKGAMGLMQIMPETWAELRARYGLGADPYDPRDNILAGAAYMRELHVRYGSPGFLAAYNAGPRRYQQFLATGRPLPDQTLAYVATLAPLIESNRTNRKIAGVARSFTSAGSALFVVRSASISTIGQPPRSAHPNRPRNDRAVVDLSALVPQSGSLFVRPATEARSQ